MGAHSAMLALAWLGVPPVLGWEAYNAAGVWGVAPNRSYHPTIANVLFQPGWGPALETAHRDTGATGLYQMRWTVDSAEKNRTGWCKSPIPRFYNTTGKAAAPSPIVRGGKQSGGSC